MRTGGVHQERRAGRRGEPGDLPAARDTGRAPYARHVEEPAGDTIAEREPPEPFDLDALAREQPSWRLHRAHPALGLLAAEGADEHPPRGDEARDLGLAWLRLPEAEQRRRERDFATALLRHAARCEHARFGLESWAAGATGAALRTLPEVSWDEDGDCWGPLTDDVIDVLARRPCNGLLVTCDGRPFVVEEHWSNGPARTGLCVWLDPWSAGELRAELDEAWWPAAEARAAERRVAGRLAPRDGGHVSRETRAAILYAWERRGWVVAKVALLLVLTRLLADTWLNALVILVALLTVLLAIDGRLERWHRRS